MRLRWRVLLYIFLDGLTAAAAFLAAVLLRFGKLPPLPPSNEPGIYLLYIGAAVLLAWATLVGVRAYETFLPSFGRAIKASLLLYLVGNLVAFYAKPYAFSRLVFLLFAALFLLGACLWRLALHLVADSDWGGELLRRRVAIVGLGPDAKALTDQLGRARPSRFQLIGFLSPGPVEAESLLSYPVLGPADQLDTLARQHRLDEVLVTQDALPVSQWIPLVAGRRRATPVVRIVPGRVDLAMGRLSPESVDGLPLVDLLLDPITGWTRVVKRALDVGLAAFLLLLLSPILVVIAGAVALTSRGPILYVQERLGKGGRPFRLVKFRSMVPNAEDSTGPVWAEPDDRRITPVGRFLRRTGLDEVPQLWNILRGEMSLVGPRPERAYFVEQHSELSQLRLSVKPGITGLAQVQDRYHLSVPEKVQYDIFYIQNYTLGLDLEILWRTLAMILRQEWSLLRGRGPQ